MYVLPGSFLVALQTRKGFDILEHPIDGYGSNQVDYKIIRFTQRTHMQTRKKRIWHLSEGEGINLIYERMVAAYPIGYSVTKDYLEENPHLKFATGETDTGVIISWNTEGPRNVEENATNVLVLPNAISINPLNWKLDETYAPASENLGSVVIDVKTGAAEIRDIGGDAQVNTARGTVVTNADAVPNDMTEYTGPQSYHQDDYSIFYNNIKENVTKRIAAYQANQ